MPRTRILVWGSLLALAVVLVVVVLVSGSRPGSTSPLPAAVLAPGPASIFQDDNQLLADPAGTLDQLRRLGVDRVRVDIQWGELHGRSPLTPSATSAVRPATLNAADPAAYPATGWYPFDTIVRDARARGIGLDLTLAPPPPRWAEGPGAPNPAAQTWWKPNAKDFELFVRAVATRYSGSYKPPGSAVPLPRVRFWSIWNEPNLGFQLAPQAINHGTVEVSPRYYRALLDGAWSALEATGHGHDVILFGELGPAGSTFGAGPGNFNAMAPLRFLRALYCVDASYRPLRGTAALQRGCPPDAAGSARFTSAHPALFHATGVAVHPYSQGLPPNTPTPTEPDYAELASLPTLERVLDSLQHVYGSSTRFPLWSTEFGYQTAPPDTEPGAVSPQRAAYYLNWSEYLTWLDPRIRSYDQYLLVDGPLGNFATALEFPNRAPKQSYYAYRMPIYLPLTSASAGQPLEVWGCVRPADYARLNSRAQQRVQVQLQRGSHGSFQTVKTVPLTNARGYFDVRMIFASSGAVRLAWSYPSAETIYSRIVNIAVH